MHLVCIERFEKREKGLLTGIEWKKTKGKCLKRFKKKYGNKKGEEFLKCPYCNCTMINSLSLDGGGKPTLQHNSRTVDHVSPPLYGGKYNDLDNMVYACHNCNDKKGEMSPLEFIFSREIK